MSKVRNAGFTFLMSIVLLCASIGAVSGKTVSNQTQPAAQESAVVGGDGCSFAHGLAFGLGIAGLFGCVPCEGGALVVEGVALLACS